MSAENDNADENENYIYDRKRNKKKRN